LVADHYQYFSILGPIALAVVGMTRASGTFGRINPFVRPALSGLLLVVLGVLTWRQCGMYASVETLWRATIARNPACWMAYNNLGSALLEKGRVDEAISCFQKALENKPDF